jgi:EAL domain-containing protein (putative c-di-GMP-specific phosphodiesterase class I)/GGDEF domain-containing protein
VKVLIVERQDPRVSLARRLLSEYHLGFEWSHAASDADLRAIAEEFKPQLVFCADRMPPAARRGAMELLMLLSLRNVEINLVCVGDTTPNPMGQLDAQSPLEEASVAQCLETPAATWRGSLPSMLDTSWDAVALSDAAGWMTCANTNACFILCESNRGSLGTILDPRYFSTDSLHRVHRMAFFDNNDGYPTPVHVTDLVARICARAEDAHTALPIAAFHLPGLRVLTEAMGAGVADAMLGIVDQELRSGSINCGMVARLGEDDAIVVLPDPSRPSEAAIHVQGQRRASQLQTVERVVEDRRLKDRTGDLLPPERRAKERREPIAQAGAETTPPALPMLAAARPAMESGLDDALRRDAIGVHYQPQFELDTGRGCGIEALARWYLTTGEAVAPTVFIPAAERAGMIGALGARVLKIACDAAATWHGRAAQRLTLSVKVSTLQINNAFSATLTETLRTSGFSPERLELEVAESALLDDRGAITRCLLDWKDMGVRIAVIHAANDYSSLRYLSKAPIDRLKLDRTLIGRMGSGEHEIGMVRALIALGQELGIAVIAEGVETEAQLHLLTQMHCPQAQGYLLGRPMPLVPVQIALRKPWGNLPKAPLLTSPLASASAAPISAGFASRS